MTKRTFVGTLAAAILAAFPAAAAQASPHDDQYGNPVQKETPPTLIKAPADSNASGGGSALPFTGLELGLIVAGGGAAAGAGLVLRRTTRGRRS